MARTTVPTYVIFWLAALLGACSVPFHADLFDAADHAKSSTPPPATYILTPGTLADGSMTPTTATTVNAGAATAITATPSTNYVFSGWTAYPAANATFASGISASTTVALTGNATITPAFTLATTTYTLTPGTPSHGTMTPAAATTVNSGAATSITATPSAGYVFAGWSASPVGTASFGDSANASTTVMLNGNATITPKFVAIYTLTPGSLVNGTMTPAAATTVNSGAATSIAATPSAGYAFTDWSASPAGNASFASAVSASTTVTLSGNATITPAFSAVPYSVLYSANGLAGYTPPTDTGTYTYGQTVTAMAPGSVPAGSAFGGWSTATDGSGTFYSGSGSGGDSSDTFTMGTATVTLYAQWMTVSGTTISSFTSQAQTVVIPYGVTAIGAGDLRGDPNLTSVTIPSTITGSGFDLTEAFMYCPNLTTITLASGSPYVIENGALVDPSGGGTLIAVPAKLSGNFTMPTVAYIDDYAFSDCSQLTGITISNAVATALGGTIYADYFSGMHSPIPISVPSNIATIAAWAFEQSYFTSVTIQGSNVTIQANAFSNDSMLTTVVFTSATPPTSINSGAFTGASASLQIQVPASALAAYQADAAAWGSLPPRSWHRHDC